MKYPLLYYVDLYANLLPLAVGMFRWPRIKNNEQEAFLLFMFTIFNATIEISNFILVSQHVHSLWVLHLYNLVEFCLIMTLFSRWFRQMRGEEKNGRGASSLFLPDSRYLQASILAYALLWVVSLWTFERLDEPPTITLGISTFLFIPLSLITLFRLIVGNDGQSPIFRGFRFWVALGILLYFAGSSIDFLLLSIISTLPRMSVLGIWQIHWIVDIGANLSYAIGYTCLKPPSMA